MKAIGTQTMVNTWIDRDTFVLGEAFETTKDGQPSGAVLASLKVDGIIVYPKTLQESPQEAAKHGWNERSPILKWRAMKSGRRGELAGASA